MEKITTKSELRERLKDVRAVEMLARKGYQEDLSTFSNFQITETISKIKIDEDKHIQILSNIIDLLKE